MVIQDLYAVSYTHLDVYKRQVLVNAQILKGKGKYELLPVKVDNGAYHADGLGEDGCQGRAGYS